MSCHQLHHVNGTLALRAVDLHRCVATTCFFLPSPLNHALEHAARAAKVPPILHQRIQRFHISIRMPPSDFQKASMWLTGCVEHLASSDSRLPAAVLRPHSEFRGW
jgi:hypothetical protein